MGYRLRDMMDKLEHSELMKIKNDLDNGALHLKRLVDTEIKKNEMMHKRACSVCMGEMQAEDINNFTLVFGPESFRKKASFCGIDCLEYFIKKLKEIREKSPMMENDIEKTG